MRWGPYHREIYQYLGQGTNNIAELTAIKVGLEAVKNRSLPVRVYTDSQYSIGVLSGNYKVKANRELILSIRELMKGFPALTLHKVRGHAGDPLNERADELARLAVTEARSSR
jgi:ribonuclease HI